MSDSTAPVWLEGRGGALRVPAGRYRLSARLGGEQDVEELEVDRHLVCVADFREFIDAGGYEEQRWWSPEGWRWKVEQQITKPRFFGPGEWRRFVRPTRPIVGVSFYEAEAYARFLGRRLPTEAEWEATARGPAGRAYPWGEELDVGRVGMRGMGPRVTWPCGYFPRGAGPFGHLDLVGNVWQWTTTKDRGGVIVRGGSWASRPEQGRTDFFNVYDPSTRHSHVGFRTVRS